MEGEFIVFLYTVLEAVIAIVAGIIIAARTKKSADITYGKLDKVGIVTNILLIVVYLCLSPLYLFFGMISTPAHAGFWGIVGWIISIIIASATLFCGLGLGFSVALRKKGKSNLSFVVQFAGVVGIGLSVGMYCLLAGNLLKYLN